MSSLTSGMTGMLDRVRHGGAEALSRGAWALAGAALAVSAALFVAAALTIGLSQLMPLYAALLFGALALAAMAAACVFLAAREHGRHDQAPAVAAPPPPLRAPDLAYKLLESEIQAHPGKTAAAAVVAGLMLGALEALERRRAHESESE